MCIIIYCNKLEITEYWNCWPGTMLLWLVQDTHVKDKIDIGKIKNQLDSESEWRTRSIMELLQRVVYWVF